MEYRLNTRTSTCASGMRTNLILNSFFCVCFTYMHIISGLEDIRINAKHTNIHTLKYIQFDLCDVYIHETVIKTSGLSCSKLTTSLVNDSLKFRT